MFVPSFHFFLFFYRVPAQQEAGICQFTHKYYLMVLGSGGGAGHMTVKLEISHSLTIRLAYCVGFNINVVRRI